MIMKSNNLNDLFDYGYKIYQDDNYFKFSIDSVLLAEFVDIKRNHHKVLDICSGNAPIPLILNKKYGNKIDITGVELQKEIFDLGNESIVFNKIDNIKFINDDIKNFVTYEKARYDIITCNPPYFKVSEEKILNDNIIKAKARHEISIDLESIISISSKLLNNKGYFYLVHHPTRLADIISILNKYHFGVKRIVTVYDGTKDAILILVEAILNGENYVKIGQPIYLSEHKTYQNIFKDVI